MSSDPYDALQDARGEARYEDDPRAEPDLTEVKEKLAAQGGDSFSWLSDDQAGFRG